MGDYMAATLTFRNSLEIYEYMCRPLCKRAKISQGELDVLLFLANHPGMDTAVDICKCGGIKQSMLSTLVEKLVQNNLLERRAVPDDRRKVRLAYTESAEPLINEGREIQKKLSEYIFAGISKSDTEALERVRNTIRQNTLCCREKMLKGEEL